jgi:hypothetical protein
VLKTLSVLPVPFWVVIILLTIGAIRGVLHMRDGLGLPTLVVLVTIAAWYVGDAFYNDYAGYHTKVFEPGELQDAWWQVAWFLAIFLAATPRMHAWFNAGHTRRASGVLQLFKCGMDQPAFQGQLTRMFNGCACIWIILALIAIVKLQGLALYFFFPFLGFKASPWDHGRIGAGFDFVSVIAVYLQLLVAGMFGVVLALSNQTRIRWLALTCCLVTWPYFIFDRTRNTMLAVVIPGVLSWVFLRLRGSLLKRIGVLGACFLLVNAWMGFVIANRTDMSIVSALKQRGFNLDTEEKVHHEGLNMYEELCWINTFIKQGTYKPNWGGRYFAEIVNPIPRRFWPSKPLIGIDYAVARGQGGGEVGDAGVYATISTGMIGQGVVNFGRLLGPAFAALLMSLWVAILVRLDLHIQEFGRLPLYALGIILTFNLGRDITLITLYPFLFGSLLVSWVDRNQPKTMRPRRSPLTRPAQRSVLGQAPISGLAVPKRQRFGAHRMFRRP